jgi:hypothetical protein
MSSTGKLIVGAALALAAIFLLTLTLSAAFPPETIRQRADRINSGCEAEFRGDSERVQNCKISGLGKLLLDQDAARLQRALR